MLYRNKLVLSLCTILALTCCGCKDKNSSQPPAPAPQPQTNTAAPTAPDSSTIADVQDAIELWRAGQKDQATQILLECAWLNEANNPQCQSILNYTETQFVSLSVGQQEDIRATAVNDTNTIRDIARSLLASGKSYANQQDVEQARKYLEAVLELGAVLDSGDRLAIVKAVGRALKRKASDALQQL